MIENNETVYLEWFAKESPCPPWQKPYRATWTIAGQRRSLSGGPGPTGYDLHVGHAATLIEGHMVKLWSAEAVRMPTHTEAEVGGKSTWAGMGVSLNTTSIDPGFRGHIMLEATYHPEWQGWWAWFVSKFRPRTLTLPEGVPIGTLKFHYLTTPRDYGSTGQYNNQKVDDLRRM